MLIQVRMTALKILYTNIPRQKFDSIKILALLDKQESEKINHIKDVVDD